MDTDTEIYQLQMADLLAGVDTGIQMAEIPGNVVMVGRLTEMIQIIGQTITDLVGCMHMAREQPLEPLESLMVHYTLEEAVEEIMGFSFLLETSHAKMQALVVAEGEDLLMELGSLAIMELEEELEGVGKKYIHLHQIHHIILPQVQEVLV